MRRPLLFPAALISCALVAQAPGGLVESFNREAPAINKLMAELHPEEALAKAEGLIPAQKPTFNPSSLKTLNQGSSDFRALGAIYKACGNAAASCGDWNKALDYFNKAVAIATENRDTIKAQALPKAESSLKQVQDGYALTKEQWGKMRPDFLAKEAEYTKMKTTLEALPKRSKEQETDLAALKDEIPKLQADVKANDDKIKQFEGAIHQNEAVLTAVQDMVKELDQAVVKADGDAKGLAQKIADQQSEIQKFNADQLKKNKKLKIVGNKNWAEAVMNGKANFADKTPQEQANLLRRLLVLDPTNKAAEKALGNIKEGRDIFFVEKRGSKSKKTTK